MDDLSTENEPTERLPRPITLLHMEMRAGDGIEVHQHPWGQLAYALQGVLSITAPNGSYLVPPQRAVWIPPNIEHSVFSLQGAEFASVYIERDELESLLGQCQVVSVSNLLRELIGKAVSFPPDYDWQGSQGRITRALRDELAEAKPVALHLPVPTDSRLCKLCDELQINPGDKRTLEQWAELVGASSRTLTRLFLAETGLNFRAWRRLLRLQTSLQLLSEGQSVTAVALELGYESSSAFIAVFQEYLGVSPGEFISSKL